MAKDRAPTDLSSFRELLRAWDAGEDRFTEIVTCAAGLWPDGPNDLADACLIARPTIRRWIAGVNLPHPGMRGRIVAALREKILSGR